MYISPGGSEQDTVNKVKCRCLPKVLSNNWVKQTVGFYWFYLYFNSVVNLILLYLYFPLNC